jgi:hypothetical protein
MPARNRTKQKNNEWRAKLGRKEETEEEEQ